MAKTTSDLQREIDTLEHRMAQDRRAGVRRNDASDGYRLERLRGQLKSLISFAIDMEQEDAEWYGGPLP